MNAASMTIERAREITAAIVRLGMYNMDIVPDAYALEHVATLRPLPLGDLLMACRMVAADPGVRQPDGTTTMHMTADERLIAAVYTALHYTPERDQGRAESIVAMPPLGFGRRKAVLVLVELGEDEG